MLNHMLADVGWGTMAFHFRFIMPGEWACDQQVAVGRLVRVIRALCEHLAQCEPVFLRMEQLFYTQDLGGELEAGWRRASALVPRSGVDIELQEAVPLDRILVVSATGIVRDYLDRWCSLVRDADPDRFLYGLLVDQQDRCHKAIYLSPYSTPIGMLHEGRYLERSFESIEFEPVLSRVMRWIGVEEGLTKDAMLTALELLGPSMALSASGQRSV